MISSYIVSPPWVAVVRHCLETLLSPFFIGFVLFLVILLWVFLWGNSWFLRVIALILIMGSLLVSTGWLPRWMIETLENKHTQVMQADPSVHWVVVFGGGVYENTLLPASEALSGTSIKRLLEGIRVYRQLPDATLILSGGGAHGVRASVGARMGDLAAVFALPELEKHVVLETESINTADEAVAIKQWVHDAPFYLVTSARHMPRAMALCRRQGLNPIPAPCDYTYAWKNGREERLYLPNIYNVVYTNAVWHEVLGLFWGKMRGKL